jgi:iron complex outermembrane receptor protein
MRATFTVRILIPIFLFLAGSATAQEQQATIRVEVTAESKPVEGAAVTINGQTTLTGASGIVSVQVAPGTVQILVIKDDYFPSSTSITAAAPGEFPVEIELKPQEDRQETITVSATRTDARIQDSPLHVEVIQRDEIDEETMMKPGDMVMLLNEMGGMRAQTTSPSLGAASVRVQGMLGRYTAFLSDGLPLFGQQGAGLGLLQIPPIDLGQVEVIKGNTSALYGSSAMAGVVDLISRRPTAEPIHEVLLNTSTLGSADGSVFFANPLSKNWSASFLGSGNGQVRRDLNGDSWADVASYGRGVIRPRFYWNDKAGNNALLTGGITYEDRNGGTMPDGVLPVTGQPYPEALLTHRYDFGGSIQRLLLPSKLILTARFSLSELQHRHTFGEVIEHDRHELIFSELALRGTSSRNIWVAGLAAQRDSYRPHDVPRFAYTYDVGSLFLQDDLSLAPWFSVSASGRLDVHNVYGTFFSPRLSALIRHGVWTSRLSLGQGFFAPTALTEETEAAGLTRLVMPKPLVAERGRSVSADLTRTAGPLSVTATLFASNIDHPVYVERTSSYEIVNLLAPRKNRGVEFLATWRKAPFSATFSYNYVHASEEPTGARVDVPLTPRHNLGIVGTWEKEGKARIGLECYYTGEQRLENNPYRDNSHPYVLVGAMGERTITKHTRLFINLENLSNIRQTHWDPLLLPTRSVDGRWTVDAWAPLEGRVINGGARFSF